MRFHKSNKLPFQNCKFFLSTLIFVDIVAKIEKKGNVKKFKNLHLPHIKYNFHDIDIFIVSTTTKKWLFEPKLRPQTSQPTYYEVSCLIKCGVKQWKFPTKPDICDYVSDDIVEIIKAPTIVNNRNVKVGGWGP